MIPILTTHTNQSFLFELVIPSLPGFGYSSPSRKPDCQAHHVAKIFFNLMRRLNHEKFYVHGGDWGGIVATHLTTLFPKAILGFHSNFCFSVRYISLVKIILGSLYPPLVVTKEFENNLYPVLDLVRFYFKESGYLHIQGTKPDTIGKFGKNKTQKTKLLFQFLFFFFCLGAALDHSPEGLFTFLLEKLSVGANKHNIHLDNAGLDKFNTTTLLDIILYYYWFPKRATTSARFYAENVKFFEIEVNK